MTLYVQNVSYDDVKKLKTTNDCSNTLLISIVDSDMSFPTELGHGFWSAVYYKFLDVEGPEYKQAITTGQAGSLVRWIEFAKRKEKDILVHCIMGINRSGAIREVAEVLGFEPIGQKKGYNAYVKTKLLQAAGLSYE